MLKTETERRVTYIVENSECTVRSVDRFVATAWCKVRHVCVSIRSREWMYTHERKAFCVMSSFSPGSVNTFVPLTQTGSLPPNATCSDKTAGSYIAEGLARISPLQSYYTHDLTSAERHRSCRDRATPAGGSPYIYFCSQSWSGITQTPNLMSDDD